MQQFNTTFQISECRCHIPLAVLGLVPLLLIVIALLTGQPMI
jgi:hypothetical protein